MREKLKDINRVRQRFTATFVRFGTKKAYKGYPIKTLLFENVTDKNENILCDHIWFTTGKQFERLELHEGDKVCFDARVRSYTKGYKGRREDFDEYEYKPLEKDYKLSHPNKITKHIEKANQKTKQYQLF